MPTEADFDLNPPKKVKQSKNATCWAAALESLLNNSSNTVAWYAYARSVWLEYGNSLGMSNEAYLRVSSGSFLETLKETLPGNAITEHFWIWTTGGVVLGLIGF